ncbi:hypothetical protein QTO34_014861 [Cnephaeus nilssonii]|uniref:Uncharacterized protein n=1 Tax=Cnephaeus nilssonii TaxID=3371016 RepID=A0AA40LSB2_CNENI|nr:hypothetical protein QTO34_014861 [Eptesicus nilssonii]
MDGWGAHAGVGTQTRRPLRIISAGAFQSGGVCTPGHLCPPPPPTRLTKGFKVGAEPLPSAPEQDTGPQPSGGSLAVRNGGGALRPLRVSLTGAVSLGYKFTVTPNGQPWCGIQGQVNGNTFLHYTCGGQRVTLTSVPGVSATRAWNQQRDALQDVVEELRKTLLDMKAEMTAAGGELPDPGQRQNRGDSEPQRTERDQEIEGSRGLDTSGDKGSVTTKTDRFPTVLGTGPLSLQASMTCEQESSGRTSASWEFESDGQTSLRFVSKNGHWTVLRGVTTVTLASPVSCVSPKGPGPISSLCSHPRMCPYGCPHAEGRNCTGGSPGTAGLRGLSMEWVLHGCHSRASITAASATATATVPSKASANRPITSVLPVILTCAVLVGILGWAFTTSKHTKKWKIGSLNGLPPNKKSSIGTVSTNYLKDGGNV